MTQKLQILGGGLAALLVPVGLAVAYFAWGAAPEASVEAVPAPAPLEAPSLTPELATTTRADATPRLVAPPAPVAREVDPFEPELVRGGGVEIRRLVVATGIAGHEPTGASDRFEVGESDRVYAFVEAVNAHGEAEELTVTFEPAHGEASGFVALDVPARARRWRTWAFTRHVYTPGRWHAVVRDSDGHLLARRAFDVTR